MAENRIFWALHHADIIGEFAVCRICESRIICSRGKFRRLVKHLKNVHQLNARNSTKELERHSVCQKSDTSSSGDSQLVRCLKEGYDEINFALIKMIIINNLPETFSDSEGFRKFAAAIPGYTPSNGEEVRKEIDKLYNQATHDVKRELNKAGNAALIWSKPFLTVRFVDQEWEVKTLVLGRAYCMDMLMKQKHLFVHPKVYGIMTDDINFASTRDVVICADLRIDSIVNEALWNINIFDLYYKSNKICHYLRTTPQLRKLLKVQNKHIEFNEMPQRSQKLNHKLNWRLIFKISEQLLENRQAVAEILASKPIVSQKTSKVLLLEEQEWQKLEEIKDILYTVSALKELLDANDATISMVRPMVHAWINKFLQPTSGESAEICTLKSLLIAETITQFELKETENVTTAMIAPFLDPRSKNLLHESDTMGEKIRQHVKNMLKIACKKQAPDSDMSKSDEEISDRANSKKHAITQPPEPADSKPNKFQLFFENEEKIIEAGDIADVEWARYLQQPEIRFNMNPFEWWQREQAKFPQMAELAKKFLCIPATTSTIDNTKDVGNVDSRFGADKHTSIKMTFLRDNINFINIGQM